MTEEVELPEIAKILKTNVRYVQKLVRTGVLAARKQGRWYIQLTSLDDMRKSCPWNFSVQYYKSTVPTRKMVEQLAQIQWSNGWGDAHMSVLLGVAEKHWTRVRNGRLILSRSMLKRAIEQFPELKDLL